MFEKYYQYIDLGYWPSHFKSSSLIIIPKPNKMSYNSSKLFYPIILLNFLEKLIKKLLKKDSNFILYPRISFIPINLEILNNA